MARPERRQPLTRRRIVDAAVSVADRGGVNAVTMRKVADALGVEAMALYHHVPNKESIVDAVVDAVFSEIDPPPPDQDWRAALEAHCWSARRAVSAHSWVLGLVESRQHVGTARLKTHDAVLGTLLRAGFSPLEAVQASSLLDSYVYGFVLQEQQHDVAAPTETQHAADDLLAGPAIAELPHLRTVAEAISAGRAPSHDEAFAHGLGIVLDGLRPGAAGTPT